MVRGRRRRGGRRHPAKRSGAGCCRQTDQFGVGQPCLRPGTSRVVLAGEADQWRASIDSEIYGVGVLVNVDHGGWVEDEEPPTDDVDGWTWDDLGPVGHYGDDLTARAAVEAADAAAADLAQFAPRLDVVVAGRDVDGSWGEDAVAAVERYRVESPEGWAHHLAEAAGLERTGADRRWVAEA